MSFDRGSSSSPPPPPPCCFYNISAFSSPSTCFFSSSFLAPHHSSPPPSSVLCKANWGTAQYAKDYGGMLSRKGRQTLTGHFHCALPPQQSAHRGLIWLSHSPSLFAPAVPPPDQSLSLLLYITFSPLCLSPSRQCAGNCEGISMLEGQRVWELESKVNGVDRWIWYQYRLFWRTRPPPIPRSAVRSEVWHPSS